MVLGSTGREPAMPGTSQRAGFSMADRDSTFDDMRGDHTPHGLPFQAGMSANVTIDTDHQRHLFGSGSAQPGLPR
jgi:hypothetical protein